MFSVRKILAQCGPLKDAYHSIRSRRNALLYHLSPVLLAKLRYRMAWGRWPDLSRPTFFDEKLLWLMLYWQHPLKTKCGDKHTMRAYVHEQGLAHLLPRLFAVYDSVDAIDFAALPDRFVLKCTHGCKCNVFCRSKSELNVATARRSLHRWMRTDYSLKEGEMHYAGMQPRIMCEEFLQEHGEELPLDYKVLCFGGTACCTMACQQREPNGKPKLDFYDRAWQTVLPYAAPDIKADRWISKPAAYDDIIQAAEVLSKPFPFVRMDFYSINGKAVLGEMTFTPGGCVSATYLTPTAQRELGSLVKLPEKCLQ